MPETPYSRDGGRGAVPKVSPEKRREPLELAGCWELPQCCEFVEIAGYMVASHLAFRNSLFMQSR